MTDEKLSKMIDEASNKLMEHFDTVRIFVTKHESGETSALSIGKGNIFAQVKQIEYWVSDMNMDIPCEESMDEDEEANYHK